MAAQTKIVSLLFKDKDSVLAELIEWFETEILVIRKT